MDNLPQPANQNDDNRKTIVILLSILSVICLFTLGAVSIAFYTVNTVRQEQKSYLATEQAHATNTAVSAASTAVYQATQVAEYRFFDDFEDNKNEWSISYEYNKYWKGVIDVRDGVYIWDVKGFYESDSAHSWRGYKNAKPVADFDLSVDAKLATPDARRLCYAVAFRSSPDGVSSGAYIFSVCDDQDFFVQYHDDLDNHQVLMPWTHSDAIRSGDWNTLAVSARGDHFVLSINNVVVSEFTDTHLKSGKVYLMIQFYDKVPGTIMFDNFGLQPR